MIDYFKMLRPQQWGKNLFLFAGLIFSRSFYDLDHVLKSAAAFLVFCLLSGAVYIINDLADYQEDQHHSLKSRRPIASHRVPRRPAAAVAVILAVISIAAAALLPGPFVWTAVIYLLMMTVYSLGIKTVVILDLLFVAFGYVIRAVAGALVIGVSISSWLLICTLLLALFLVTAKRRYEIVRLGPEATRHRRILGSYTVEFLTQLITIVASACIVAYCLYTLAPETVAKFHTRNLIFTVPFVLFGVFRYLYLTFQGAETDTPEKAIITDPPLLICLILWVGSCSLILTAIR